MMSCYVVTMFQVKALGQALWDAVVRYLNLLEADYFDLEFQDLRNIHVRPESMASVSRAWCKTIVTSSFYIRSYNSFALSHRFAFV